MKLRWLLVLALAAVMLGTLIACDNGDGAKQGGETPSAAQSDGTVQTGGGDYLLDLIVYSQLANFSGEQIGWAAQIYKDKFNVRMTIIPETDGTFATRMAAGNLGDIVLFGSDSSDFIDAANAGLLFDWDEEDLLTNHGPYIKANMQLALEKNRGITAKKDENGNIIERGKLYGFGHDVAGSANDHIAHIYYPYMRWDLYNELGRPAINTLEDFIPVLKLMQEMEPVSDVGTKTYGVSSYPDWDGDMVMMVKSTGALYGWEEFGMGLYHVTEQRLQGALDPDGMYLRCLKFYNTLFQMGLYDPDSVSQTFDDAVAKYKNGTSFWNIFTFVAQEFNTDEHLMAGKALQCVPAKDQQNVATELSLFGMNRVWSIGAKTNYPELCMQIINWFCTPEGVLVYNYGPQGVTWDYDDFGNTYLTDVGMAVQKDRKTEIAFDNYKGYYEDGEFQHNNTTWARDSINPKSATEESFNWETWASTIISKPVTPIEQSWRDWAGAIRPDVFLDEQGYTAVSRSPRFSMAKRNIDLELMWTQVTSRLKQGTWQAIYAKSNMEYDIIVSSMVSDCKAYGYDECLEWLEGQAALRKIAEDAWLG